MQISYRIQLPQFEGPFDLLLFFIERDELDIQDIPISQLTNDFLAYLHQLESMNMEVASEFILVAGTLMRIKAKMLLPRPEINEKGEEVDPRDELVRRLLEYRKYKSVIDDLVSMEDAQQSRKERGGIKLEEKYISKTDNPLDELASIDVYALMKTFQKIWVQHQNELRKPRHVIRKYPYTMDEVRDNLREVVKTKEKVSFLEIVLKEPDKMYFVFNFLGILELTQEKVMRILMGADFNDFWITRRDELGEMIQVS
ncbi:MAG: segregation and condensation protein A [Bacteroidia bacterium]